jgi:hypothetical protein
MQPLARCLGRYRHGLTPWRLRGVAGWRVPVAANIALVKRKWKLTNEWLTLVERQLRRGGATVLRGSDFDRWDLEVRGGIAGAVRVKVMTEDLGDEKQLVRWRVTPRYSPVSVLTIALMLTIALAAVVQHHPWLAYAFWAAAAAAVALTVRACGAAVATFRRVCPLDEVA